MRIKQLLGEGFPAGVQLRLGIPMNYGRNNKSLELMYIRRLESMTMNRSGES